MTAWRRRFCALAAAGLLAGCAAREEAPGAPLARWIEPSTGMELLLLPAGELEMGSPADEPGHEPGERRHRARLSRPVWLGRTEVTQAQWEAVMGSNPSANRGPDLPVESVSSEDVERFLEALEARSPASGFRLPTETEWERACRAGTTTAYSTGATLESSQANFDGRYPLPGQPKGDVRGETAPVGSYPPNPWGFADLHGNVWEWVADDFCPYPESEDGVAVDPLRRCGSGLRAIRGGSWLFDADSARCALRYTHRPGDSGPSLGFRVARDVGE